MQCKHRKKKTDSSVIVNLNYCTQLNLSKPIGKDFDTGKDRRQEEKGTTEDETVGWHHWLNGHEFEEALGDGVGSLACCSPWSRKESDTTEQLNNNKTYGIVYLASCFWTLFLINLLWSGKKKKKKKRKSMVLTLNHVLSFISGVTLDKLLNLSGPYLPR